MNLFKSVKIIEDGKSIIIQCANGSSLRYHSTWLRDNSLDSKTRDAKNGQRLITLSDIPLNIYIESATLDKKGENILLTFLPENKKVSFSASWLEIHAYDKKRNTELGWIASDLKTWGIDMSKNIPNIDYKTAKSNKNSLLQWLKSLYRYGFAKTCNLIGSTTSVLK